MNESIQATLVKANRAVQAAKTLLKNGDFDFAVSRAYYAMFYAVEAMLASHDFTFRKHGGVHAAFGEHFVKTKKVDEKNHRWLLDAFGQRLLGDYEIHMQVDREDVEEGLRHAEDFVSEATKFLKSP